MGKGQQLTERQRDKADAGGSGWRAAGHQLKELLCLLICGPAEGTHFQHQFQVHGEVKASVRHGKTFRFLLNLPETSNTHESTVEPEQGAGLHHVLLSETRVPRAAFHIAVVGDVCAARARQDGHQL